MVAVDISGRGVSRTRGAVPKMTFMRDDYMSPAQQLLPNGPAWPRDPDTWMMKLVRAIAHTFSRVGRRARDLLREADPSSTKEMLPDWERALGLGAVGDRPTRLTAIASQLQGYGDPSKEHAEQIAADLGYLDAEVKYYSPLFTNDECGLDVHDVSWRHRLDIVAHTRGSVLDAELERRLAQITQTHLYRGHIDPYRKLYNTSTLPTPGAGSNKNAQNLAFVANARLPGSFIIVGQVQAPDPVRGAIWASRDARVWKLVSVPGLTSYAGTFLGVAGNEIGDVVIVGTGGQAVIRIGGPTLVLNHQVVAGAPDLRCVATNGTRWVVAGAGGTIRTIDRPALTTFVARTAAGGFVGQFRGACWSEHHQKFYLVGDSGEVQSSPDGVTWTRQQVGAVALYRAFAIDDKVYLSSDSGSGVNDTGQHISSNGTSFAVWSASPLTKLRSIVKDHRGVLVVAGSATGGPVAAMSSVDGGANWVTRTLISGSVLNPSDRLAVGNAELPALVSLNSFTTPYWSRRDLMENAL